MIREVNSRFGSVKGELRLRRVNCKLKICVMEIFYDFLTSPPLCKGRWHFREKMSEGLALSVFITAGFLSRLFTIPQSTSLTAPFAQGSLFKFLPWRIAKQFISRPQGISRLRCKHFTKSKISFHLYSVNSRFAP